MRVHATLRDDIRLWVSALAGAVLFYGAIVLLGIAPLPFGALHFGSTDSAPAIVVPRASDAVRVREAIVHARSTAHRVLPVTRSEGKSRQSAPTTSDQLSEEAQTRPSAPERGTAAPAQPSPTRSAPTAPSPSASAQPTLPTVPPDPLADPPTSTLPLPATLPLPLPVTPPPVHDPVALVPPVTLP